jgi:hypothetical protein
VVRVVYVWGEWGEDAEQHIWSAHLALTRIAKRWAGIRVCLTFDAKAVCIHDARDTRPTSAHLQILEFFS